MRPSFEPHSNCLRHEYFKLASILHAQWLASQQAPSLDTSSASAARHRPRHEDSRSESSRDELRDEFSAAAAAAERCLRVCEGPRCPLLWELAAMAADFK